LHGRGIAFGSRHDVSAERASAGAASPGIIAEREVTGPPLGRPRAAADRDPSGGYATHRHAPHRTSTDREQARRRRTAANKSEGTGSECENADGCETDRNNSAGNPTNRDNSRSLVSAS
jgi:hypothetical protein